MIVPVEKVPFRDAELREKRKVLVDDIKTIIEGRVPCCKIVCDAYSPFYMKEVLKKTIRNVVYRLALENGYKYPGDGADCFEVHMVKDKVYSFYVTFDLAKWDAWKEVRK